MSVPKTAQISFAILPKISAFPARLQPAPGVIPSCNAPQAPTGAPEEPLRLLRAQRPPGVPLCSPVRVCRGSAPEAQRDRDAAPSPGAAALASPGGAGAAPVSPRRGLRTRFACATDGCGGASCLIISY